MTQAQAQRAITLLHQKQWGGDIIPCPKSYAVQARGVCFTSIKAFQSWLKTQSTLRQYLDELTASLNAATEKRPEPTPEQEAEDAADEPTVTLIMYNRK